MWTKMICTYFVDFFFKVSYHSAAKQASGYGYDFFYSGGNISERYELRTVQRWLL